MILIWLSDIGFQARACRFDRGTLVMSLVIATLYSYTTGLTTIVIYIALQHSVVQAALALLSDEQA